MPQFLWRCILFIVLAVQLITGSVSETSSLSATSLQCRPRRDTVGNSRPRSVKLLVKELYQGMSNMYSYGEKQISKSSYVINSNTTKVKYFLFIVYSFRYLNVWVVIILPLSLVRCALLGYSLYCCYCYNVY